MTVEALSHSPDLEGIRTSTNPGELRQKSRDFYWFSPILKAQLDDKCAEMVVYPADRDELARIVAVAASDRIPLTPRGGGTGNYGQCVPLEGGIVIDFAALDRIVDHRGWTVRAEAGIRLSTLNETLRTNRQEMRLIPSTVRLSSLGGFVGGGAGGVGSINWGLLSQPGNVLAAQVMTMEPEPRLIELRGPELANIFHAYGTTGLITEVALPLTAAHDWVESIFGFDTLDAAIGFSRTLAEANAILKRDVATVEWPVPRAFRKLTPWIPPETHIVFVSVADFAHDALDDLARRMDARLLYRKTAEELEREGLPPNYEYCWNHATLNLLLSDRKTPVTYLQCGFPDGRQEELIRALHARVGDEVHAQLQWVRLGGVVTSFGLHLVRFTTPERLYEVIDIHREIGITIRNPHVFQLEHGEPNATHAAMAAFKHRTDPAGLLNPGKMASWDAAA